MLRRALDEAENHEKERQQKHLQDDEAEIKRLIPPLTQDGIPQALNRDYGSTSSMDKRNRDFEGDIVYDDDDDDEDEDHLVVDDDDDDEEEYSLGADDYQNSETERNSITDNLRSIIMRAWSLVKGCLTIVVNVENVWDSPTTSQGREIRRRNHFVILFWFFILAISYTTERVSFKLLVDRSGPFRLLAVEVVAFTHAFMVGSGMLFVAFTRKDVNFLLGIPVADVALMAFLDNLHMMLVFLTGYHVAPTLTVILVQFTLPLTALISQVTHPDGYFNSSGRSRTSDSNSASAMPFDFNNAYTRDNNAGQPLPGSGGLAMEHISGLTIISLAVLLALCPSIYTLVDKDFFKYATTNEIPIQTAFNTILFVSSCIPAAASQLYKEYIFHQYKQPVQPDYLNFLLSSFQLIFASIMSPLVYILLGFAASDDWTDLYPSSDYSKNVGQGLQCVLGILDEEDAKDAYYDEASCQHLFFLIVLYSFSVISVGVAVDKIVNGGATKVMYRGVSVGIILSVISLYLYDLHIPDFNYGAAIDSLNLICLILLVVGSEIYHRVSLQDASFETVYPEIESFFDDVSES